jgi:MFS family permease
MTSRSIAALNWLNFFAADVATGVGPFLAIYLSANRHWRPGPIGIALSAMSFATVIVQTPAGYIVDKTTHKRGIILVATSLMAVMGVAIPLYPHFALVTTAQVMMGIAAAFYAPTLIALAACLVRKKDFDRTISRNQTYNHAGNVASALLIGLTGRYTNNEGVFYCLFVLAVGCSVSTLLIRRPDIDHPPEVTQRHDKTPAPFLKNKPFVLFLAAAFVFHFANAAMLPLVGQEISAGKKENASLYMSACIILAQLVMVPVTAWCGRKVIHGRKRLLLAAFIILPLRGVLYVFSTHAAYLVSIQILDGISAGIFGVVSILVINDLAGASNRSSLAQGMLATAVGLGASLSNLVAGYIVQAAGFTTGFLSLAGLALAAMALLWIAMPETLHQTSQS